MGLLFGPLTLSNLATVICLCFDWLAWFVMLGGLVGTPVDGSSQPSPPPWTGTAQNVFFDLLCRLHSLPNAARGIATACL